MWKVTLKGIWAKKVRFLLTGVAVMLGVAFVSGTFVLTATISKTFDNLFADEPTGNLDSKSGAEILTFMRKAVDELGQTIVMVTHDPGAAAYADRVVFLADGHIVAELAAPTADSVLDKMRRLGE